MNNVAVLIPSLEPKEDFVEFLKELNLTFKNIVVVNDGSSKEYDYIFNQINDLKIPVIKNHINLGKGRALKYGINYILNTYEECKVIVTADSDGQHSAKDIQKCAKTALENLDKLILGVRDFDKANVPPRSKFGNKITRNVFKLFVGLNITDTQTGLRAFSTDVAIKILDVLGERFDYETNMLIATKDKDIEIKEVEIETIYLNENSSSHFNPLKDSLNIYKLFLKYIFSAVSSFVVDILLFTLFYNMLFGVINNKAILASTVIARIISSLYNYFINAKLVFKKNSTKSSIIKYYILVLIQMCVSAGLVYVVDNMLTFLNVTVIKIIIDTIIFVVNFYIQREWIFKKTKSS